MHSVYKSRLHFHALPWNQYYPDRQHPGEKNLFHPVKTGGLTTIYWIHLPLYIELQQPVAQMTATLRKRSPSCALAILLSPSLLLCGCMQSFAPTAAITTAPVAGQSIVQGIAHGGLQAITGATVQLYAVGTTGDGSAATPLITSTTVTTSNGTGIGGNASNNYNHLAPGSFIIGSSTVTDFSCPSAYSLVYITITGGSSGGGANPNIALMAAIGYCGTLNNGTSNNTLTPAISLIDVNEVSTVAAVYALSAFMSSYSSVGSSTIDSVALASAFTLASQYSNIANGSSPGTNVQANLSVPSAQINTIANILSSCVNTTGGVAGDNTTICGKFFQAVKPSAGSAPTETVGATLDLALNATTVSVSTLFSLITGGAPYNGYTSSSSISNWSVAVSTVTSTPLLATGDSRTVTQPTYPTVCQTISAQFTTSQRSSPPTSDDTTRLQTALTACKNTGQSVVLAVSGSNNAFFASELNVIGEGLVINSGVTLYANTGYATQSELLNVSGTNSSLMGPGTVDGRGDIYAPNGDTPRLVQATNITNFTVYNVTLTQALHPNLYVQGGTGFTAWNVNILTPASTANADGIDIDSLTNATVTNSSIEAGDDGVAIKTNSSNISNVTVQNNRLYGTHGLSIGSIAANTVTNILFQNNYVYANGNYFSGVNSTYPNAINVKVDPCALTVTQVTYLNTCITEAKHLIYFSTSYSTCSPAGTPVINDVVINGVTSTASQSGAYEYFNGYASNDPIVAYLANINLDAVSILTGSQYGTYSLDNSNVTPSGTGITTSSFTTTGSVPICAF